VHVLLLDRLHRLFWVELDGVQTRSWSHCVRAEVVVRRLLGELRSYWFGDGSIHGKERKRKEYPCWTCPLRTQVFLIFYFLVVNR